MASPPFNINQALPGDTDIVSQHPANARTFRDVVESWLLVNHDTNGYHSRVDIPRTASPTTPAATTDVLYTTTTGRLKIKHPDATEEYVGLPPGVIVFGAGALDTGYLEADGSAVSRSTFADLYAKIGTTYGIGDGVTTFNLPDLKGRVIAGIDASSTRLSTAYFGTTPIMAATGGFEAFSIAILNLPAHHHSVFLNDPGHTHTLNNANGLLTTSVFGSTWSGGSPGGIVTITENSATTGITVRDTAGGAGTANQTADTGGATPIPRTQPTIIQRAMIKY